LEPGTKDLQLELDMPKTCFYPNFGCKILKLKEKFKKKIGFSLLGLNMLVIGGRKKRVLNNKNDIFK
jgi:hypothetical protein